MEFKPLPEQAEIIDSQNKNLLVSASAGSGKTTVMIARICKLIESDLATPKNLLVMTYTTSAASEMKQKLYNTLKQKISDPEILDEIATSDISTIHSFCSRLLKKYFYVLGISPNFEIADDKKSLKIKKDILTNVLTDYASQSPAQYFLIMQNFAPNRNIQNVIEIILKLDNFSQSFSSNDEFCKTMLFLYDNTQISLDALNQNLLNSAQNFKQKTDALLQKMQNLDLTQYITWLNNVASELEKAKPNKDFFENYESVCSISLTALKRDKDVADEVFKQLDNLKTQIKNFVAKYNAKKFVKKQDFEKSVSANKNISILLLQLWKKFCNLYKDYKSQKNLMDYSDLEKYAIEICSNSDVQKELKQTYKYVFVDEYQDTNQIQNKLVELLCGQDNKFLVGDVKQSIYGFRRSKPQIFLDLEQSYALDEHSEAKYLNVNFRSDKQILCFVNFVFDNIMTPPTSGIDYKKNGRFKGVKQFEYDIPKIKICLYNKKEEKSQKILARGIYKIQKQNTNQNLSASQKEACIVAKQIFSLVGKTLDDGKPITYSDITILVRKRGDGYNQFCDELSHLGLPIYASNNEDILQNPETAKFLNLLKTCTNINDDFALTGTLIGYFDFDENQLATIRLASPEKKYFYECLQNYQKNDQIFKKIADFYQKMQDLQNNISFLGSYKAVKIFFEQTRYFEKLDIMQSKMRSDVAKILVEQLADSEYNFNISKFLDNIQNGGKLSLPDRQSDDSNFVNVTTIHSSKGLEYKIVFLVDSGSDFNKSKIESIALSDSFGIGFKYFDTDSQTSFDDVILQAIKDKNKQDEFAEKLRLLYVGLTRAKNALFIVGGYDKENLCHKDSSFDITNQNNYLSLVLSSFDQDTLDKIKTSKDFVWKNQDFEVTFENSDDDFEEPILQEKIVFGKPDQNLVKTIKDRLNQNFKVQNIALKNSVSGIMKGEDDGYQNKTDQVKTLTIDEHLKGVTNQQLGTEFHKILQILDYKDFDNFEKIQKTINRVCNVEKLDEKTDLTITVQKVSKALEILNNLFGEKVVQKEKSFILQAKYNQVVQSKYEDLVLVQGIIDAFCIDGDNAILVDFKLSNTKSAQGLAQRYQKQLELYALAIQNAYGIKNIKKYILNLNFGQLIQIN